MNDFLRILLFIVPLILIYIGSYFLNKKVEKPEGTVEVDKCSVCNSNTCTIRDMKEAISDAKCEFEPKEND